MQSGHGYRESDGAKIMGRFHTLLMRFTAAAMTAAVSVFAQAQSEAPSGAEAFEYEERSTLETIQFDSIEEETLANTVIEGGLEAPAAGVPLRPISADDTDSYMDPLALEPRDRRTEQDRNELPVEYRFNFPREDASRPAVNLPINLPSNRTYEALNVNTIERP